MNDFICKYDVVVCGGGIAGCAAAIAAARRGMKTVMIEKSASPGGLATSGLVLVYLPLCDGKGKQVMFGLAEELLHLANKYGPANVPSDWKDASSKSRFSTYFSPASFVLALDELLTCEKVDVWYDTMLIACKNEEGRIRSVSVANKSGITKIPGNVFVDATGDADLAYFAGHCCHTAANSMVSWIVEHRESESSSHYCFGDHVSTRIMSSPLNSFYTRKGIDGKMVSDFLIESRRRYRDELIADYNSGNETRSTRYPLLLPSIAPLRHSRCIRGKFMLKTGMGAKDFKDSIGLAAEWRYVGTTWAIPYRALLPKDLSGILAAGKCISAKDDAWEITRVIPSVALTGEVAGVAAALSVQKSVLPDALLVESLQNELRSSCGFPLSFSDL
jgi:FAD dependent oxidoreductase